MRRRASAWWCCTRWMRPSWKNALRNWGRATCPRYGGRARTSLYAWRISHTAGLNSYFSKNSGAADALLIVSSGLIDALGLFLLGRWLFGGSVRPFLGLFLLMTLRQLMQAVCALPPPPNMIWHYPGFPSLLVTYHVANDFFFSGHTAIAVFGAIELSRLRRNWLTTAAVLLALFEVATVLILRAHYSMDVFTGVVAGFWVANLSSRISPRFDQLITAKP